MIRKGRWKYNLYSMPGVEELYDMEDDPGEMRNLASLAMPEMNVLKEELIHIIRSSSDEFQCGGY